MSAPDIPAESYIGDGVYASFDGFAIWLRTDRGAEGMHRIALEPAVFASLVAFEHEIEARIERWREGSA